MGSIPDEKTAEVHPAAEEWTVEDPKLLARVIGANLKHLRKQRFPQWGGQKKFADYLGLSQNDLCVYEYGRATPNEHRLAAIAERLEMTVEQLRRPLPGVKVASPAKAVAIAAGSGLNGVPIFQDPEVFKQIEDLKHEVARLEGRLEILQEQKQAQEEQIQQLQEANYVLRDLLYTDDMPKSKERRERLLSLLNPSIAELAKRRDVF